jgi:hypothetical protein
MSRRTGNALLLRSFMIRIVRCMTIASCDGGARGDSVDRGRLKVWPVRQCPTPTQVHPRSMRTCRTSLTRFIESSPTGSTQVRSENAWTGRPPSSMTPRSAPSCPCWFGGMSVRNCTRASGAPGPGQNTLAAADRHSRYRRGRFGSWDLAGRRRREAHPGPADRGGWLRGTEQTSDYVAGLRERPLPSLLCAPW